jgi:hypothetical protein
MGYGICKLSYLRQGYITEEEIDVKYYTDIRELNIYDAENSCNGWLVSVPE